MQKRWIREELEDAFERYVNTARQCVKTGSWGDFGDVFTEDARYFSNGDLVWTGREAIRQGVKEFYSEEPFNHFADFELNWHVVGEEEGRVVFSMDVLMDDSGDGSVLRAGVLIHMQYGGNGMWCLEEDWFNFDHYRRMADKWAEGQEIQSRR